MAPRTQGRHLQQFRSAFGAARSVAVRKAAGLGIRVFGAQLRTLLDLIDHLPQTVAWKQRLATPQWRRAMAARTRIDERIADEIARARRVDRCGRPRAGVAGAWQDDAGDVGDQEIRDQVVTLIAAGYGTTSAAAAWAVYAMLSTPGCGIVPLRVRGVLGDRPRRGDLSKLDYLNGVVRETLRLYSCGDVRPLGRHGFHSPAGRSKPVTCCCTAVCHPSAAELWPDPLRFRPQRGYRPNQVPETTRTVPPFSRDHRASVRRSLSPS